ncbi:MAG: type II toxin-antitoxin system VapC family toxin, partial [Pseudonocardiaceae bacterium]
LAHIARYEIDELVRTTAAEYTFAELRTLDAIHLATAHAVFGRQLTSFVTYDKRLLGTAEALGLPVASPPKER